jgi:putative peptidoglycan lipid II flippase
MSVSAAELPALSRVSGEGDERNAYLRSRVNAGLRQIAFFIVPSAMAFFALGDIIAAFIYQTGRFTHHDAIYVWAILAGSAIGLLASTLGRLYQSTYWALRDTRTPLYYAVVRVVLTAALGYACALPLPPLLGLEARWGAVGLAGSAGVAGWLEFILLRRGLKGRIGKTGLSPTFVARLWIAAGAGAAIAWSVKLATGPGRPLILGAVSLSLYGIAYFGITYLFRVPEAVEVIRKAAGAFGWKKGMAAGQSEKI